jgi:phospholipid/cholesterol/gamma-HCH transport system permease protein
VADETIAVEERLERGSAPRVLAQLDRVIRSGRGPVIVDLGSVERFDSAGIGAIVEGLRRAGERGREVKLRGLSQPMLDFFSLISVAGLIAPRDAPRPLDPITRAGAAVEPLWRNVWAIGATARDAVRSLCRAPLRGGRLRLDRAVIEIDNAANGALPIVALIAFLLGLILAMQAWVQLRVWGAEIYIADMVGVSVVTEIGPLMTAIVLAARSGSSNAAQLGAMVVGEEIDAVRQMGVDPVRFLVVPKVLALAFSVVALGLLFDVVAMSGGALFASAAAGIEFSAYQAQTRQALHASDFLVALGKSAVFGSCIGVVGCALGLRVEGGSQGVGRATTDAVVLGIFLIIVIDALFVAMQRLVL